MRVEYISKTLQGEAGRVGIPTVLVRMVGCNLDCDFCDQKESLDSDTGRDMEIEEVLNKIEDSGVNSVMITGGEPLVQNGELESLLQLLQSHFVEVETNGTIKPGFKSSLVNKWNVSPKLSNSGNPTEPIDYFVNSGNSVFKYVCGDVNDLKEVDEQVEKKGIPRGKIWILPKSHNLETYVESARKLVEPVCERGYSLSPRLQYVFKEEKMGGGFLLEGDKNEKIG